MGEKTEAPTPRKRDEARAKGQGIGRSAEFSMGLTLGVGTLALSSLLPGIAATLVARTQASVDEPRSARHQRRAHRRGRRRGSDDGDADPAARGPDHDRGHRRQPGVGRPRLLVQGHSLRLLPHQSDQRLEANRRPPGPRPARHFERQARDPGLRFLAGRRQPGPRHRQLPGEHGPADRRNLPLGHLPARPHDHDPARRRGPGRLRGPAPQGPAVDPDDQGRGQAGVPGVRGRSPDPRRPAPPGPPDGLRPDDGRRSDRGRHRDQPDDPRRRPQVRLADHAGAPDRRQGPAAHGRADQADRAREQGPDRRGQAARPSPVLAARRLRSPGPSVSGRRAAPRPRPSGPFRPVRRSRQWPGDRELDRRPSPRRRRWTGFAAVVDQRQRDGRDRRRGHRPPERDGRGHGQPRLRCRTPGLGRTTSMRKLSTRRPRHRRSPRPAQ